MKQWLIILLYGFCRWLGRVQRGATSLAYWGIFSVACNAARKFPNKLWYFPLVNIRTAASVLTPYIFSPRFSVAASSALRIGLASPASSALPIGTRAYRTGSRSSPYTHYSVWTCRKGVPRTLLADAHRLSVLPYRCQGNSRFGNSQPICPPPLRDWKRSSR